METPGDDLGAALRGVPGQARLTEPFGSRGMKDALTHLGLQFWNAQVRADAWRKPELWSVLSDIREGR